ncbi:hypothetical protein BGW39_001079 [Mortierella sp. 14UC]|nr:hypothetical protein BGW39_001079 [Mortierella sp. 14UC]
MPSSNSRSTGGFLSIPGAAGNRTGSQDLSMYDFLGGGEGSDRDPYSKNSSVVEYDAMGMIHLLRGVGGNRSPTIPAATVHLMTDSYTVTAPVQRQRWYVMRFLAQWRMSKIIFVPYSKLLVIVDMSEETVLAPLDYGGPLSPTSGRRGNLPGSASSALVGSTAGGVAPGADSIEASGASATRLTIAPGASGSGTGATGTLGAAGDVEEAGSSGSLRRRLGSISGFNNGVRRMSTFLGLSSRNPTDNPLSNTYSGMEGDPDGDGIDDSQQQQAGGTNQIEQGTISEHIIRVISIHNQMQQRSSFHPLQPLPFSVSMSFGSNNIPNPNQLHLTSSSSAENSPLKRVNPMRFDSDMTQETSVTTVSSQDTERKQIREQAARINQQMRATTTRGRTTVR